MRVVAGEKREATCEMREGSGGEEEEEISRAEWRVVRRGA